MKKQMNDDEDKSLLRELNDNPGQFTRIMQILNSKNDETPRHSNVKKIRISNMSKNLSESISPDPSRYSILSENSKAMKNKNDQELGSFYKKLKDGMKREMSDDSGEDSEVTSDLLTEVNEENERQNNKINNDDSDDELRGSIY